MAWFRAFVPIFTGFCYVSNMLEISLPYCTAVKSGDKNAIVKSLVAASKAGSANANFAQGGFGQSDEDSPIAQALQIISSQPSPGLDTLSEEELDEFLAGLEAPKPTTMLTVATSMPTKRSTPSRYDPDAEAEMKRIADQFGLERCPWFVDIPGPCWWPKHDKPAKQPPS
ncbi:hypothetical protein QM012_005731 [Aureobasidium pullulans]|uniref:Uncharacterized protein n=1 Tax=Aureobasidium pullulans TaxID=5580 RepID=A0ABR0TQJ3_AURPU